MLKFATKTAVSTGSILANCGQLIQFVQTCLLFVVIFALGKCANACLDSFGLIS